MSEKNNRKTVGKSMFAAGLLAGSLSAPFAAIDANNLYKARIPYEDCFYSETTSCNSEKIINSAIDYRKATEELSTIPLLVMISSTFIIPVGYSAMVSSSPRREKEGLKVKKDTEQNRRDNLKTKGLGI